MEKYKSLLINVGSNKFEGLSIGKKAPQIIFLNGYRMNYKSWDKVYPEIAKKYSVFLYNRLGIGRSSKANRGQEASVVNQDMHDLFQAHKLTSPYIFVAHSMGGLFADLYARTYKDEVAGIIFIDCPHPEEIVEQKKFKLPVALKLFNNVLNLIDRLFDRHVHSEDNNIERTTVQIQSADRFPEIPIAVVSGQKKMPFVPKRAFDIHLKHQHHLLNLSPYSVHYLCHKSGHFPQISEPNEVITAILETVAIAKSSNKPNPSDIQ